MTSTALTLLVIPALYRWFAIMPEREAEALAADSGADPGGAGHPLSGHGSGARAGGPGRRSAAVRAS